MNIPINTDLKNYFPNLLTMLHKVLKLTPKEIQVLSSLMLVHYLHKDQFKDNQKELEKLLFSKNTKEKMSKHLNMTEGALSVVITSLRKLPKTSDDKLISKKTISPFLVNLYPSKNPLEINYVLTWTDQ